MPRDQQHSGTGAAGSSPGLASGRLLATAFGATALAAVIFLLVVSRPGVELPPDHALPVAELTRSGDGARASGLEAYEAGELELAAGRLRTAREDAPPDPMLDVVLASALTRSGQHDASLEILESLSVDDLPEAWRSRARWTHYVALRGARRPKAAQRVFDVLVDEPGEIGDLARSLRR